MSLERDLFLRCLDLPDTVARRSFLARACGDDSRLEADVVQLLDLHRRAGSFLEEPAAESLASRFTIDDRPFENAGAAGSVAAPLGPRLQAGDLGSLGEVRLLRECPPSAFGPVWSGVSSRFDRAVTVRALDARFASMPGVRGRFLRLARHLATVRHVTLPAILSVEERPVPFLLTVAIEGDTLDTRLRCHGPLSPRDAASAGATVAAGLAAVHAVGLSHRRLCPENVWLRAGDRLPACLLDVGLARALDDDRSAVDPSRHACPFLAPEQVLGATLDPLDHRPDLFALGCVIAAMATGRSPFEAVTPEATLRRVAEVAPAPGSLDRLPCELGAIVAELLVPDPARRPVSADVVAARLAALAAAHG